MNELAVCTIITKSYLPYARTLASSLMKHNPDVVLYVLLVDRIDCYFDPSLENFKFIYLEDLSNAEEIEQMCFYYNAFELCCALRGFLHEYMFDRTNIRKWIFLDSDIMIFSPLDVIFEQLKTTSILLTPHNTIKPINDKYIASCEVSILRCGLYNAGFLGLNRTAISKEFIAWFKNRLKNFAFDDTNQEKRDRGLFVDQLWLNLAPLYFDDVKNCSEPGANLGYWNFFDRILTKDSFGEIKVNEEPLLFIHFSGWDINNPSKVTKHSSIYDENEPNFWLELSELYKNNLLKNNYNVCTNFPYAFNFFHNGKSITPIMRRQYYDLTLQGDSLGCSPFSDEYYLRLKPVDIEMSYKRILKKVPGFSSMINFLKTR
jgi:lipopolysaccharide biosynthesis glycosyltransferase